MNGTKNSSLWRWIILIVILGCSSPAHAKYGGGSGTADDPYLIKNADQMNAIGANQGDWNKHFKLIADIDLSSFVGSDFNMIGYYHSYYNKKAFSGVFDGNGHTISNFTYNPDGEDKVGIFVYLAGSGQVRNVCMLDPDVVYSGSSQYCLTSPLVTYMRGGSVENCWVYGGSVSGRRRVGAVVGYVYAGQVTRCWAESVEVRGSYSVGGLLGGTNWYATVSECYANCDVQGGTWVGGCIGENDGWVQDSYAQGRVSGSWNVGGFMGAIEEGETTRNCYSTAKVEYTIDGGGFSGSWGWGIVEECFWDIETSGQTTSGDGTGLTTAQMQDANTFIDAGWDFNTPIWKMCEVTGYPKLWWQLCPLSAPVLQPEPEVTLGTSNTILWDPVGEANEYYAECSTESNFVNIYNSGWITDTNCTFWDLNLWQEYWYRAKSRTAPDILTWLQTSQEDFETSTLENIRVDSIPGSVVLAKETALTVTEEVGGTRYNGGRGNPNYITGGRFNFFECTSNCTLKEIRQRMFHYSGKTVQFVVYEAMEQDGQYEKIHSNSVTKGYGVQWSNSHGISVPLIEGRYYAIGVVGKGNLYYYDFGGNNILSWGTRVGSGGSSYPAPDTLSYANSSLHYGQRLTTEIEPDFYPAGNIVAYAIDLCEGGSWADLEFSITQPADTNLTVDVLDASDDSVIIADANDGENLSWIDVNSIKLRANLSTDDSNITPALHDWLVTYTDPTTIIESNWSNMEWSMQGTLADAVDIMLDPNSLKNENMKNALLNKIDEVLEMIDGGLYEDALSKLENDILAKMNGCSEIGEPDKNDWIITCEAQDIICPLIIETIEHVKGLME